MDQKTKQRLAQCAFYFGLAVALVIGAQLRLPDLGLRPVHLDEAIQAVRFIDLLEEGTFDYLPEDGHGPGLLYFALPVAKAVGVSSYSSTTIESLRLTPAIFGLALIALTAFSFRHWLGVAAGIISALLTATSPMLGFYSRYFIMETPLVFFLLLFLICSWRYILSQRLGWLIAAGICGAIMHATKEPFGISVIALVVGAGITGATHLDWFKLRFSDPRKLGRHLAIALPISLIASAALYSVFFTNPKAIPDSYTTYLNYLDRASGTVGHDKPWHYYIKLLLFEKKSDGFNWSEALTLGLAIAGTIAAYTWKSLPANTRILAQILALYTLLSFVFYSAIPYKTPWSIMSALHAAIILAGFGAFATLRLVRFLPIQIALIAAFLFGIHNLIGQSRTASFPYRGKVPIYAMENRNPYVYGHTTTGFVTHIVKPLRKLLAVSPDGKRTVIRIIHKEAGWPIPWYFREYPINPTPGIAETEDAPIVITDDLHFDAVQERLGDAYTFTSANLREEVWIYMFYKQELFDKAHPDL